MDDPMKVGHVVRETTTRFAPEGLEAVAFAPVVATWVLTTGRSGTKFLTNYLSSVNNVQSPHEPYPTMFWQAREHLDGTCRGRDHCPHELRGLRRDALRSAYAGNRPYVETGIGLSALAPCLLEAVAGSRFIHLHRDPRAFVASGLANGWMDPRSAEGWFWPRTPILRWPDESERWCRLIWYWTEVHRRALELERCYPKRVLRISSEALFTDPATLGRVLAFVGAGERAAAAFAVQARLTLERGPVNATPERKSEARASAWQEGFEPLLRKLAGPLLEELGYLDS